MAHSHLYKFVLLISTSSYASAASSLSLGPSSFTVPAAFPTSAFSSYYNNPTQTTAQVQPVITDPVLHTTFPESLTDPFQLPVNNTVDPHPLPTSANETFLVQLAMTQIINLSTQPAPAIAGNNCAKCITALGIGKMVALSAPKQVPDALVSLCNHFKFSSNCAQFGLLGLGSVITQVLANADVGGFDGQMLCFNFVSGLCPRPPTSALDLTSWFAKPKPNPLPTPKTPSGERVKVLHISDLHLDPRYVTGSSEANCTSGLCCRSNSPKNGGAANPLLPAPQFGWYRCDSPYSLILAAMQAIPVLAGTQNTGFDFTIFTGDLASHDPDAQLSRSYVEYAETVLCGLFKSFLGSGSVYATLGNHDSYNQAQDAPHNINPSLANEFSWNYNHVAGLWDHEKWLPAAAITEAKTHYGAYSVQRQDGLRVISLNTDLWYKANWFNYINMTSSDNSGILRFLTDELQDAEDSGDRVWIIGHVLSGWDGTNPLSNPTNLFYQIVDRFSPHVIANIFFGHTHEDQFSIFYANNATSISAQTAQTVSWMGPSVVPLTNLNSGFRVYEVDSSTFEVMDAHTWSANVNTFTNLGSEGPLYTYEYSTRQAYGANIAGWIDSDPLNATWWHHVTEQFEANPSLVQNFTTFQGKSSPLSPACTSSNCTAAKICYMRSGSASIALQNCIPGFGSVQSG